MCIHCCRLRRTPCPPIPYSCPHCPVRTISSYCPLSGRASDENPFLMTKPVDPPSDPCDTLPTRWLHVNRRVIYALAKKMNRSPEAAHYAVLLLLYANYEKILIISQERKSFRVPRSDFPEQDLFSNRGSLFNAAGFVSNPMAPDSLGKLLRMLQDYISRLRRLNNRFKWYANGDDREEILCMLGEQDELVRLLRELFGDSHVVSIPQLLKALHDLDLNSSFGKLTSEKTLWPVKRISDLYSEVVDPNKSKNNSSRGCGASKNQIQEVTLNNIIFPNKPQPETHKKEKKKPNTKRRKKRKNKQLVSAAPLSTKPETDQMVTKPPPARLNIEMPRLVYEPFDIRKSSTWRTRHSVVDRILPDNQIGKLRVRHYSTIDKEQELGELGEANDKDYGDMFGAHMPRRSTRNSLIRDKRKSFADR